MIMITLSTNSLAENNLCLNDEEKQKISHLIQDEKYCKQELDLYKKFVEDEKINKKEFTKEHLAYSIAAGLFVGYILTNQINRIEKRNDH